MSLVSERFHLSNDFKRNLSEKPQSFGFGAFSSAVYYRTYSRQMENGKQERWSDTVIRVVEGVMSIRKSHYRQNNIQWDNMWWSALAERMAEYIFDMKFLPPGRGLIYSSR